MTQDAVSQCSSEARATPHGRRGWLERHCATNLNALALVVHANDPAARHVVGSTLSVADVAVWACVRCCDDFDDGFVAQRFPHLHQFASAFEQRHSIKLADVP